MFILLWSMLLPTATYVGCLCFLLLILLHCHFFLATFRERNLYFTREEESFKLIIIKAVTLFSTPNVTVVQHETVVVVECRRSWVQCVLVAKPFS